MTLTAAMLKTKMNGCKKSIYRSLMERCSINLKGWIINLTCASNMEELTRTLSSDAFSSIWTRQFENTTQHLGLIGRWKCLLLQEYHFLISIFFVQIVHGWCWKQLLCPLCHYHCPCMFTFPSWIGHFWSDYVDLSFSLTMWVYFTLQ